jgi:hypothetical protein
MEFTRKNSHELIAGDIVSTHGALIQLKEVYCLIWEKQKDNACVVAVGECINLDDPRNSIPRSWFEGDKRNEWNCQGNKLANWYVAQTN